MVRDAGVVLATQKKRSCPGQSGFGVENLGQWKQPLTMASQAQGARRLRGGYSFTGGISPRSCRLQGTLCFVDFKGYLALLPSLGIGRCSGT